MAFLWVKHRRGEFQPCSGPQSLFATRGSTARGNKSDSSWRKPCNTTFFSDFRVVNTGAKSYFETSLKFSPSQLLFGARFRTHNPLAVWWQGLPSSLEKQSLITWHVGGLAHCSMCRAGLGKIWGRVPAHWVRFLSFTHKALCVENY